MAAFDTSLQSRLTGALCALLLALSCNVTAQPDKDWWACQFVETAGLDWQSNSWKITNYAESAPFVIVSDGKGLLSRKSVAKATLGDEDAGQFYECRIKEGGVIIYCADVVINSSLSFNPELGMGAMSYIYGGVTSPDADNHRDGLWVSTFECIKG